MGAPKVIGGLMALVGGFLVLVAVFDNYSFIFQLGWLCAYLNLIFAIIAIIGGFLGLVGKKSGGGLALLIGVLFLLFGILVNNDLGLYNEIAPFSYLAYLLGLDIFSILWLITIESIIILIGGVLILADSED